MSETFQEENLLGNDPPEKIFFQVYIKYNPKNELNNHIDRDSLVMESDTIANYPKAYEIAEDKAMDIHEKNENSNIVFLDDGEIYDEYLIVVTDGNGEEIARLGIQGTDYRNNTIH